MKHSSDKLFWTLGTEQLLVQTSSQSAGLSSADAAMRLRRFGYNRTVEHPHTYIVVRFAKRMIEPLVAILLIAAAVAGLTGDLMSFAIILTIVSLSIILDVVQEHHAQHAVDALRRSVAVHADVIRDGEIVSIPVEEVVPGDVVEVKAGDLVPADGVLLSSHSAHTNESLVTGEPYPVAKRAEPCSATPPADAFNALFAGTSVVNGEATMLVVTTGADTYFGGIAAAMNAGEPPSSLERGTHDLGLLIMRLTAFLVLFVLLVHTALGRPALDSFLFAVALAVGLTPELLPMVMTVTLSRGALRMASKHVIVKRLTAIHDLGAMDVLCCDKTGTLTEARIALVGTPDAGGQDNGHVLDLAALTSQFATGIRSPLDNAILLRRSKTEAHGWVKTGELPFDFERRRVSVAVTDGRRRLLIVKGAPESVIPLADRVETSAGEVIALGQAQRENLQQLHVKNTEQGFRVLAVGWKELPLATDNTLAEEEMNLVIAGYCVFDDPPRAEAREAIQRLGRAGVKVKVISGDNIAVVSHLAKSIDISSSGCLSGDEIDSLTDQALAARIDDVDLFGRISPGQKVRIIAALQSRRHLVGFIGDGVNDAPAITAADVGLSVEGATDVARAAADMIMLERDIGVLAEGVLEGRRTLANILKYIRMGTSSNFGNMLSMALASVALPFLPLLAPQVLLNNLLYDLSEIGIPFDAVDKDETARPHRWDLAKILRYTIVMGLLSTLFDVITFVVLVRVYKAEAGVFRTAWFIESMATQILVIFVIRTWRPAWKSRATPALVFTSFAALAAALAISLLPVGAGLGFVPIPGHLLLAIAGIVATYLVLAEIIKALARERLQ